MGILSDLKLYNQHKSSYKSWDEDQRLRQAKRLAYLEKNPDKMSQEDIKRGQILLHSIDVMDEYSQSYAEDMEVATEMARVQISEGFSFLGGFLASTVISSKKFANFATRLAGNNPKIAIALQFLPPIVGTLLGFAISFPIVVLGTKAQVTSSRKGRFEAMNKDLKNPAIFALLNSEQMAEANKIAKTITLDKDEEQIIKKRKGSNLNPLEAFGVLKDYVTGDKVYKQRKADFDKSLEAENKNFGTPLSEKQIKNAKRDQQILSNMVRRIDIASQDYTENAELATNTLTLLSLGTGGLVGWLSNKLIKTLGIAANSKIAQKFIPWGVGLFVPLVMSIYSTKLQKQASRIGRFKVKQEMMNNTAEFVYVDDKDAEKMTDVKLTQKENKNIFKIFKQMIKDTKEYNKYQTEHAAEILKFKKALKEIKLSDEQIADAKALQRNLFKTFNKVDEKSQRYSESVEAAGQITQRAVSAFGSLGILAKSIFDAIKILESPSFSNMDNYSEIFKIIKKVIMSFPFLLLPLIAIDVLTTKHQKKASRVADMEAIKEMSDYRNFVDYNAKSESQPNKNILSMNQYESTNLLAKYKNKTA